MSPVGRSQTGPCMTPARRRASPRVWTSTSPCIRFGTASPLTCWRTVPTCGPSRSCSATAASTPRLDTSMWPPRHCNRPAAPWIAWTCRRGRFLSHDPPSAHRGRGHSELSRRVPGDVRPGADTRATPRPEGSGLLPHGGLGGHVLGCPECGDQQIAYNPCGNRHCPTCQATAAARWLEARAAELLPTPYFHIVFTLPNTLDPIALANPRVVYDLLLRSAAETLLEVAADPKLLGARTGVLAVLHT